MPSTQPEAHDSRPPYQQIAADLRDEIMSGELEPGSSLPSTARLTERFGVFNATIQKAVQLLKAEGLVVGRPGAGVVVREHRRHLMTPAAYSAPAGAGEPYRWLSEAAKRGFQASSELLAVTEGRPPAEVARALDLGETGTAAHRTQILMLNGEPAELVQSYYPSEIASGTAITERRKIRGGTPTLLAELGYPPIRTVDLVSACVPTREQFNALQLPTELPILRTFRVVYSHSDRPIEVTIMAKAGHLYELKYEFSA
ncbi:GntR family transcriptional regulator [Streptacidiphilus sp. EB129]|uniref:GntR family transcriptional regulator n=1 Tax=Streptacidiphilus sp. EB129 TaxID=3156262 RepID=UPI003515CBF7